MSTDTHTLPRKISFWLSMIALVLLSYCIIQQYREIQYTDRAVRARVEFLNYLQKSSTRPIIEVNHAGIITQYNQAAADFFGYPAYQIIGSNLTGLIPEECIEFHQKGFDIQAEQYLRKPEGYHHHHVDVTAIRSDGKPVDFRISTFVTPNIEMVPHITMVVDAEVIREKLPVLITPGVRITNPTPPEIEIETIKEQSQGDSEQ